MAAVVGDELRRHRLQFPTEEQVEKERGEQVVAMMAECDFGRAELARNAIQRTAAQSRAERAHRPTFRNDALDDAVRILLDDAKGNAAFAQVARQHVRGEARLFLIEIDSDDIEA